MSKPMVSGNRIFLLCLAVVLIAFGTQMAPIPGEARSYPQFLLFGSAVLGVLLFLRKEKASENGMSRAVVIQIIVFAVMILVYSLALPKISYLLSTILFLYAGQWWLGLKKKILFIVFPIILTLTIYFLFSRVLGVILPEGTWITLYL